MITNRLVTAASIVASMCLLPSNVLLSSTAHGDTFGSGASVFDIAFVRVDSPGNARDTDGIGDNGAVDYEYRISKYEIPELAIDHANTLGNLGITKDTRDPNKPATSIDWFEAARFVNWLNTSAGFAPAYKFDASGTFQLWESGDAGYDPNNLFRNTNTNYVLPTLDEWYKAAYYDPVAADYVEFATGSNQEPIAVPNGTDPNTAVFGSFLGLTGPAEVTLAGGEGLFGTVGQSGNIAEWVETAGVGINDDPIEARSLRGGAWDASPSSVSRDGGGTGIPEAASSNLGFRIASLIVPEPASSMLLFAGFALLIDSRRSMQMRRLFR
ncbi:MAG: SUMF1/EgtB/PvdO family nonheme iron enzyme [Planctomycetota bacterium]